MFEFIQKIGDKVFTEAGLVAFLLFWGLVYCNLQLRGERKENKSLNQKMYDMGMKQTITNAETNSVMDKISDTMKTLMDMLSRE